LRTSDESAFAVGSRKYRARVFPAEPVDGLPRAGDGGAEAEHLHVQLRDSRGVSL
jgi:hypothetical protein